MDYRCKNCGGELAFDPSLGKLKCKFCETTYDVSEYDEAATPHIHEHEQTAAAQNPEAPGFEKAMDGTTTEKSNLVGYECPHCGAQMVTDKSTAATACVFCNTPMVMSESLEGEFKPDYVVPFEVDRKQIADLYEKYISSKPFYPEEYSKANVIEKIKSVYLPFWLYDLRTAGTVQARGERTRSHTTSNYIVTDHDVYGLERAGTMDFKRIPVISSSKTPKDAMDSIEPYDYSKMKPFNTGYLPGFLAERYDVDNHKAVEAAQTRAANTFNSAITSTMAGYEKLQILGGDMQHINARSQYALMPAYMLFMDYDNNEDKLIAINGQTGKIVGNVPVDKGKRNKFFLVRFLLIWLVVALILIYVLL